MSKQSISVAATADQAAVTGPDAERQVHRFGDIEPPRGRGHAAGVFTEAAVPPLVPATSPWSGRAGTKRPAAPPAVAAYTEFRRICDEMLTHLRAAEDCFEGDEIGEQGSGVTTELLLLMEDLYDCPFGKGEYLKRAAVVLQSQVANLRLWRRAHVRFLTEAVRALRVSYHIDDRAIEELQGIAKSHGLDPFRGTVSAPADLRQKYRIVKVEG